MSLTMECDSEPDLESLSPSDTEMYRRKLGFKLLVHANACVVRCKSN